MATYYVSTDGSDENSGLENAPFRSLTGAIYERGLTTRLLPGDTVRIRPGIYRILDEPRNTFGRWMIYQVKGSPSAPVTFCADDPSDPPIFTGSDPVYEVPKQGNWESFDDGGLEQRGIYRSTRTFKLPRTEIPRFRGYYSDQHCLIPYHRFQDFTSERQTYNRTEIDRNTVQYIPHYAGPGLIFVPTRESKGSDIVLGHLYIRLNHTFTQKYLGLVAPISDPNQLPLRICSFREELVIRSCSYINIENLVLADPGVILIEAENNWNPSHHLLFKGIKIPRGALAQGSSIISIGLRCHDIKFENSEINGGFPPWVYWTDVKHGSSQTELGPAQMLHGGCIGVNSSKTIIADKGSRSEEGISDIEIHSCELVQAFTGINIGHGANKVKALKNTIRQIHNDGIVLASSTYSVDIFQNYIIDSLSGISSASGTGRVDQNIEENNDEQESDIEGDNDIPEGNMEGDTDTAEEEMERAIRAARIRDRVPPRKLETIYIHHNIIHTGSIAYGRIGSPPRYRGIEEDRDSLPLQAMKQLGSFVGLAPFGGHGSLEEAWIVYNNTLVYRLPSACGALRLNEFSEVPSYFLNNIVFQQLSRGVILRDIDVTSRRLGRGRKISDGNLYWRSPEPISENNMFIQYGSSESPDYPPRSFQNLQAYFRHDSAAVTYLERSTQYHDLRFKEYDYHGLNYKPGFDANSIFDNPRLDFDDYRPQSISPAKAIRVDLSRLGCAKDWPMNNSRFIGALKPI